ncbi:hypothetical protein M3Y99_00918200 [Aphelenchoides fujianensis]|nr:hypothetical protein M3Y99_00918200 [Aphelenchoides fujianensis]
MRPNVSHLWFGLAIGFFVFVIVVLVDQILHLITLTHDDMATFRAGVYRSSRPLAQRIYRMEPDDREAEDEIKMHAEAAIFKQLIAEVENDAHRPAFSLQDAPIAVEVEEPTTASPLSRGSARATRRLRAAAIVRVTTPASAFGRAADELADVEETDVIYDLDEEPLDDRGEESEEEETKQDEEVVKNAASFVSHPLTLG